MCIHTYVRTCGTYVVWADQSANVWKYVIVTTRLLLRNEFIVRGTRARSTRGAITINSLRNRSRVVTSLSLKGIGEYDRSNLKQQRYAGD